MMGVGIIGTEGWRGLSAFQLNSLGWLADADVLDIRAPGSYSIGSLSRNTGVRAARIWNGNFLPIWVEWREEVNQDATITQGELLMNHWYETQSFPATGKTVGSLLIKTEVKRGTSASWSSLMTIVQPGARASFQSGITIEADPSVPGKFTVSGISSGAGSSQTLTQAPSSSPAQGGGSVQTVCAKGKIRRYADANKKSSSSKSDRNEAFQVRTTSGEFYQVRSCRNNNIYFVQASEVSVCNSC